MAHPFFFVPGTLWHGSSINMTIVPMATYESPLGYLRPTHADR